MQRASVILVTAALFVAGGCSKPTEQSTAQTVKPARKVAAHPRPPPPKNGPTAQPAAPVAGIPAPVASTPGEEPGPDTLVARYLATPELAARVQLISDLSEAEPALAAVQAFRKLFHQETDAELKQTMLDALQDIDGETASKLELLREAVQTGQPATVRQSAIDALTVLADPEAVKILMPLLSDLDDDVREAARDAVEMLQGKP